MPDSLIINESPAHPPASTVGAQPSAKGLKDVFSQADDIVTATRQADTAFGLVWEVMEDLSALAVEKQQRRNDRRLRTQSDRLYLLLNIIDDHVRTARKSSLRIVEATGQPGAIAAATISDDRVTLRRRELAEAEDAVNVGVADDSPLIDAYHTAQDRFVEEPATSLLGVLLKLERLAEVEDLKMHLRDSPDLLWVRIVQGLIRDLRAVLRVNGQVR